MPMPDSLLREINSEIEWEWRWERLNRRCLTTYHALAWLVRLMLLALSGYQISARGGLGIQPTILIAMSVLSMLNIAFPLLAVTFKWQQRQELHDQNAREYTVLRTELECGRIDEHAALARYAVLRRQPIEALVRQMP